MRRNPTVVVLVAAGLCVAAVPTSQPSTPDQKFAMSAAADGLKEVALGRLASNQAESAAVRDCGRMMVADHSTANDQLLTIAVQEGLAPARDLTPDAQSTFDKLTALHGPAFDKAFVSAMIDDHREDIDSFQQEVDHGTDAAVKDWARNTLPVLKRHLGMVQDLNGKVGG